MRLLLLLLASLLCTVTAPAARADEKPPTPEDVRAAVARSIGFLEKEGVAWMNKQRCASCHHVPMMVWALNEAKSQGYQVGERALGEVVSWALAADKASDVFPELPLDQQRSETDFLGPLFLALAVGADPGREAAVEKGRQRLLAHAVTQQEGDGSWHANRDGRPPVHAARDIQTSWLMLALSPAAGQQDAANPWQQQRAKAADWLARTAPPASQQALVMRLLGAPHLSRSAGDVTALLEALLRHQNTDGGWGQTREMKSDAFATGQALYALSGRPGPAVAEAMRRAQSFLLRTQRPDGSWPMTSRPAEPPPPGPARDLRPIRYVGTAWATMGLVRSSPASAAAKRR